MYDIEIERKTKKRFSVHNASSASNLSCKWIAWIFAQGFMSFQLSAGLTGVYDNRNVDVGFEDIRLAEKGNCLWSEGFSNAGSWSNKTFSGQCLSVKFGGLYGNVMELSCTTNTTKTHWDTYCSVRTKPFALKGGELRYLITFLLEADFSRPFSVSGYDSPTWSNLIFFFNGRGEEIERRPLAYSVCGQGFSEVRLSGDIPKGTTSFAFQLAFDRPDIPRGKKLTFRDLKVCTLGKRSPLFKCGWFSSEVRRGGMVTWDADTPESASIGFQIACGNVPSVALSAAFVGPDGTTNTYYRNPFEVSANYFRYKVTLRSDGNNTPILRSVSVGGLIDRAWSLLRDVEPPFVHIESASPFQNAYQNLVFDVRDELPVERSSFRVEVDDVDRTAEMQGEGGRIILSAPKGGWTNGIHNAYVTVSDCRGRVHRAHKQFYRGEGPKQSEFTLRKDGMMLKNGKPFFPIGITTVDANPFNHWEYDKAFRDLYEAGFNFVQTWWKMYTDEYCDTLEKYGLTSYVGIRDARPFAYGRGRDSDAVAAWYIGDDTVDNTTPAELFDRHEMLKAVSPNKLTCHAIHMLSAPEVSNNRNYHNCADIFLSETYPARKNGSIESSNCVASAGLDVYRFKEDDRLVGDGTPRAVWPLVQFFECSTLWRDPTPMEFRGMCYAAIANGANGILFYCYKDWGPSWCRGISAGQHRWEMAKRVVKELRQLEPVLLSDVSVPEIKTETISGPMYDVYGRPSVAMLAKILDKDLYLITVNGARERVEVRYCLPGCRSAAVAEVMYGARKNPMCRIEIDNKFNPGRYEPMEVLVVRVKDFLR